MLRPASLCPRLSRVPCRSSRSHSYGRDSKRTVSRDYRSLAADLLPWRSVWGGHSCPPPLTWFSFLTARYFGFKACGGGWRSAPLKSKNNCKSGGQECPPHTGLRFGCFFLNDHFQMRGHIFVQFDRHAEFSHRFERLVDLNLSPVHVKALLGQRVRDIAGGD